MSGHISEEICTHFMNSTMAYSFKADCADQQEAILHCSCCTECYSRFSFLDHFGDCNGVELKIKIYYEKSNVDGESWSLKDSLGRAILKDGPYLSYMPPKSTYTSCIATTGCYNMNATGQVEFEIFGDNTTIYYHHHLIDIEANVDFGYSSTSKSLQVGKCDEITVHGENAPQNTIRRNIFDSFVRISGLHLLNTSAFTPQYNSSEWLINGNDSFEDPTNLRIIQRYILGIFYYSTNGKFWINKKSWMDTIHECSWYGITCYDNETVIGISLPQNNLSGSLPFEIGELSPLQNLILPNNSLDKSIPIEIANLYSLHTLDLGNNRLSGTIPTMLRTLRELKVLNLRNNHISGSIPAEIWHLDQLNSLDLSNNTITGSLLLDMNKFLILERIDLSKNFLHGSIDELKFQLLSGLTHLDLSVNSFTGNIPNGISNFTKLQMINMAQNQFRGSIPSGISNLVELQILLLHGNELTGSLPTEIGNLRKIVNISLSYNLLRGTIPTEFGNLHGMKSLQLHQNQLVGDTAQFQKIPMNKFVTDCGSILDSPAAIKCPYCTECCNSEGNCLSTSETWPRLIQTHKLEKMYGKAGFLAVIIIIALCTGVFALAVVVMNVLKISNRRLPMLNRSMRGSFAEDSVYKFLLSNNFTGWCIALATVIMQAAIFHVFLRASDFTSGSNEWEYSVDCPKDSLDCIETKTRNNVGWSMAMFVIFAFLLKDLANSSMLLYESVAGFSIQGLFASAILMFITMLAIFTSFIINYATGLSNAQILMDCALLLFLSDVDEALFSAIKVISPGWIKSLNIETSVPSSNNTQLSAAPMNTQQDLSELQTNYGQLEAELKKSSADIKKNHNIIEEKLRTEKKKRCDIEVEMNKMRSQIDDLMKNMETLMKKNTESEDLKCLANAANSWHEDKTELQHDCTEEKQKGAHRKLHGDNDQIQTNYDQKEVQRVDQKCTQIKENCNQEELQEPESKSIEV